MSAVRGVSAAAFVGTLLLLLVVVDLIIKATEERRLYKYTGCLHTCNEHTLVQSTWLQPYTSYTGALTYTTILHEPTNTQPCTSLQTPTQPYKRILWYNPYMPTTHTYSTPTKHYIPTLPLHTYTTVTTYTTPTTPITQHTLWTTLRTGPAPAHMLNEHVVGQWGGYLLVIEYYVLRHLLAIILLEPPEEGKSIEFPRKHAILADCTTMDCVWRVFFDPPTMNLWQHSSYRWANN